jgi:serine protease Do
VNEGHRTLLLVVIAAAAGLGGGIVGRSLAPAAGPAKLSEPRRPIIQLLRQQPGLPSLADTIAGACPSIAIALPAGADPTPGAPGAPAFAVSGEGWAIASTAALPKGDAELLFSSGVRQPIAEVRSDPVSGLSVLRTSGSRLQPLSWAADAPPRVGDFGLVLSTPAGSGCSGEAVMIATDFLTQGGGSAAALGLQPLGADVSAGSAVLAADGRAVGVVAATGSANQMIPAALIASITDELLRNSLSPTTAYGFRAIDFGQDLAARLGDGRSRGAGVALVAAKSSAARAGLKAGDVVEAADGSPVASASELSRILDGAGKSVKLSVNRGSEDLTISVQRSPAT